MKNYFQTVFEIIRTGHWITDSISKELKEYNIYEPQYNVLRVLKAADGKPVSVNEILDQMVQKSSNVTRIVDKLTDKGLAERTLSEVDRRKMDIVITKKGEELLAVLDKKVYSFHKPMMHNLTDEETETLRQLIKKLKGS
ncbi:MarR family transcriptional regulator [Seonamhaeicola sp.]|uniref:MarR family winged helix-turn-helix transcriptional regulator n=1 Tax=Seonamhaeicola sp. TaxID=1912245 RepID=UPI0026200101|nr:MarR family transcriptional regulator [Seonamhaeicola sp.]